MYGIALSAMPTRVTAIGTGYSFVSRSGIGRIFSRTDGFKQ